MFTDDISAVSAEERFLAIPALAYSIVGIVLIALSVSGLSAFFNLMAMGVSPGFWQTLSNIVPTLVQFALGLGLFFGSHGLVRLWSRLRYAGLRRQLGLCVRCGYDLTGNVSGVCPECGTPIEPTEAK